jgi:hypothetical protein
MLSSRPSSRIQLLYVTFLVHSWSNNCYLGFQIAVLVAIRAAYFQAVAQRQGIHKRFIVASKTANREVVMFSSCAPKPYTLRTAAARFLAGITVERVVASRDGTETVTGVMYWSAPARGK